MKITQSQLRKIINEEIRALNESSIEEGYEQDKQGIEKRFNDLYLDPPSTLEEFSEKLETLIRLVEDIKKTKGKGGKTKMTFAGRDVERAARWLVQNLKKR